MSFSGDQKRSRRHGAILPIVIASVAAVVCFVRIRHTYFIFDDFMNFALYVERGAKLKAYFLHGVFGQLVPGYRLAQAVVYDTFGPNNFATIVIVSLLSGIAVGLAVSICQKLTDDVWLQALIGLFLVFSYQQLDAQLWWASSLHTFPGLIAALAMIRLLLSGARHAEAWAGLALLCGLSCYSKTLFSLIFAFGLLMALSERQELRARIVDVVWKMRYTIAVAILYVVFIAFLAPRVGNTNSTPGSVLFFLWQSFSDATLAATLGLGSHGSGVLGAWTVVPGFAILLALIVWSVRLNGRTAVFAWLGFATYFLASMTVIGFVRSGPFPEAGLWPRYSIENVVFLLLTVAAAFRGCAIPRGIPRAATAVIGVAAAVFLQVQSSHIFHPVNYTPIRDYVENLRAALAKLPADAVIADADLPEYVMGAWMQPYNRARLFVPVYSRNAVRPREQATVEITPEGSIKTIR